MDTAERQLLERNGWFLGTVVFFDGRAGKRFGFLKGEAVGYLVEEHRGGWVIHSGGSSWKRDVFFHIKSGAPVVAGSSEPIIRLGQTVEREPLKGDTILFRVIETSKGCRADLWCFLETYEEARGLVAAGKGDARFDRDNFDQNDYRRREARVIAGSGWLRPEYRSAVAEHIIEHSRVRFNRVK